MGGGCAVLRRLQRPRAAACTCLFTRAAAALVAYQSRILCPHALPGACPASLLPPPYCSVCCRQNYQAYQEALQGLDSIVGYAVKANNNFKIMQVGGLPLLLGALEGAASAASLPQCCWSGACCRVSLLGAAAAATWCWCCAMRTRPQAPVECSTSVWRTLVNPA